MGSGNARSTVRRPIASGYPILTITSWFLQWQQVTIVLNRGTTVEVTVASDQSPLLHGPRLRARASGMNNVRGLRSGNGFVQDVDDMHAGHVDAPVSQPHVDLQQASRV